MTIKIKYNIRKAFIKASLFLTFLAFDGTTEKDRIRAKLNLRLCKLEHLNLSFEARHKLIKEAIEDVKKLGGLNGALIYQEDWQRIVDTPYPIEQKLIGRPLWHPAAPRAISHPQPPTFNRYPTLRM